MQSLGAAVAVAAAGDLTSNGTAWLLAITGLITGVGAMVMNRRGQKEQHALQGVANSMAEDKNRLEETDQAISSLERALAWAEGQADKYRGLWETSEDKRRAEYAEQERLCREYAADLTATITVLKSRTNDPVAAEAAERVLTQPRHPHAPTHERDEHADDDDGGRADLDGG